MFYEDERVFLLNKRFKLKKPPQFNEVVKFFKYRALCIEHTSKT